MQLADSLHVFEVGIIFTPNPVFGKYVPEIVAIAVAMFGFGFVAVTGAAAV
jgi:hypothetical protein